MPRFNSQPRKGQGYEFLELVFFREDLKKEMDRIRDKWEIFPEEIVEKGPDAIEYYFQHEEYRDEVVKSLKKLDISLKWLERIMQYIVDDGRSNGDHFDLENKPVGIDVLPEGNDWFTLTVGPGSTHTDLLKAWQFIVDYRDQPIRKDRDKANAARNLHIFSLSRQGKSAKQIRDSWYEKSGEKVSESVIYKVISEMKLKHKLR